MASVNNNTDSIVPINIRDEPITDGNNPAYLAAALYEAGEFYERTGHFSHLYKYGAVPVSNGKTVVDSVNAPYFLSGVAKGAST